MRSTKRATMKNAPWPTPLWIAMKIVYEEAAQHEPSELCIPNLILKHPVPNNIPARARNKAVQCTITELIVVHTYTQCLAAPWTSIRVCVLSRRQKVQMRRPYLRQPHCTRPQ